MEATAQFDWVKHSHVKGEKGRLDITSAVLLLVDHQTGLNSLVHDFQSDEFKNNVLFLAETAKEAGIPVVLTTSFEEGPNGPLWKEILDLFPVHTESTPNYTYVPRPGNINAWDDPAFVAAIEKHQHGDSKPDLIVAGIVTEVCVAFPTLSARARGYEVFVVADASGTFSESVRKAAHDRMVAAGAQMTSAFAVACELFRDWRNKGDRLAYLCGKYLPAYSCVMQSHENAIAKATKK